MYLISTIKAENSIGISWKSEENLIWSRSVICMLLLLSQMNIYFLKLYVFFNILPTPYLFLNTLFNQRVPKKLTLLSNALPTSINVWFRKI